MYPTEWIKRQNVGFKNPTYGKLEKAMQQAARDLQFEEAAVLRDRIRGIKENLLFGAE